MPRFAQLGVIASMQPYHAIDDGRWAEQFIGPRIATTYAFRSLLDHRPRLRSAATGSSRRRRLLEGIYAAVTRRTLDDGIPDGWMPAQKISVEEALRAYTATAAFASFEESRKGSLAAGYLADLVMLDHDLFTIPPAELRDAKVLLTMVGGKAVYRAPCQRGVRLFANWRPLPLADADGLIHAVHHPIFVALYRPDGLL